VNRLHPEGGEVTGRLRVLLLADDRESHAATLLEHIDALRRFSRHDVHVFNPRALARTRTLSLEGFDAVVIHYSLMILSDHYLNAPLRAAIARFGGVKIQFIQDDYRQVAEMWERMRELGTDVLFTLVPERELDTVWPEHELPGVRRTTTLAGFVPSAADRYPSAPLDDRPLDVGYRGRTLPPWLGILGQEKAWIAKGFEARCAVAGLRCNVAWTEGARIYGNSWFEFIASCRVTLGTESGASITDFDGSIEQEARAYLAAHPDADFWDVHRAVLEQYEGNVQMNVVSPRIFEAVALRTGLVLFPGEYSSVLKPDRHYIPLEKDFSNFWEVVERIRDTKGLQEIIEQAHTDIVDSGLYGYDTLAAALDDALEEAGATASGRTGTPVSLRVARWERALRSSRLGASPLRGLARNAAYARLVMRDPKIVRLLLKVATRGELRRAVSRHALGDDVLRLAALRRVHQGRNRYGPRFTFAAVRDDRGSGTRLISTRESPVAPCPSELTFPLTFSHAAVSDHLVVPLTRRRWAAAPAAAGGEAEHEFTAIARLAAKDPELVAEAVDDLVTTAPMAPPPTQEFPPRLPLPLHIVRHPRHYGQKLRHVLELIAREPALRRAVEAASLRQRGRVLEKVAKLEALHAAAAGRVEGVVSLDASVDDDVLFVRSRSTGSGAARRPIHVDSFHRLVWDHSDIGIVAKVVTDFGVVPYGLLPNGVLEVDLRPERIGNAAAREVRQWIVDAMSMDGVARSDTRPKS
jgi:hypothetical protein